MLLIYYDNTQKAISSSDFSILQLLIEKTDDEMFNLWKLNVSGPQKASSEQIKIPG